MNKIIIVLSYCILIISLVMTGCTKSAINEKDILGDWEAI